MDGSEKNDIAPSQVPEGYRLIDYDTSATSCTSEVFSPELLNDLASDDVSNLTTYTADVSTVPESDYLNTKYVPTSEVVIAMPLQVSDGNLLFNINLQQFTNLPKEMLQNTPGICTLASPSEVDQIGNQPTEDKENMQLSQPSNTDESNGEEMQEQFRTPTRSKCPNQFRVPSQVALTPDGKVLTDFPFDNPRYSPIEKKDMSLFTRKSLGLFGRNRLKLKSKHKQQALQLSALEAYKGVGFTPPRAAIPQASSAIAEQDTSFENGLSTSIDSVMSDDTCDADRQSAAVMSHNVDFVNPVVKMPYVDIDPNSSVIVINSSTNDQSTEQSLECSEKLEDDSDVDVLNCSTDDCKAFDDNRSSCEHAETDVSNDGVEYNISSHKRHTTEISVGKSGDSSDALSHDSATSDPSQSSSDESDTSTTTTGDSSDNENAACTIQWGKSKKLAILGTLEFIPKPVSSETESIDTPETSSDDDCKSKAESDTKPQTINQDQSGVDCSVIAIDVAELLNEDKVETSSDDDESASQFDTVQSPDEISQDQSSVELTALDQNKTEVPHEEKRESSSDEESQSKVDPVESAEAINQNLSDDQYSDVNTKECEVREENSMQMISDENVETKAYTENSTDDISQNASDGEYSAPETKQSEMSDEESGSDELDGDSESNIPLKTDDGDNVECAHPQNSAQMIAVNETSCVAVKNDMIVETSYPTAISTEAVVSAASVDVSVTDSSTVTPINLLPSDDATLTTSTSGSELPSLPSVVSSQDKIQMHTMTESELSSDNTKDSLVKCIDSNSSAMNKQDNSSLDVGDKATDVHSKEDDITDKSSSGIVETSEDDGQTEMMPNSTISMIPCKQDETKRPMLHRMNPHSLAVMILR